MSNDYDEYDEYEKNDNPLVKVRIYNDNRLTLTMHAFNPFSSRPSIAAKPDKEKKEKDPLSYLFMSLKEHSRLIKSAHKKLWDCNFEQEKCLFITLTLKKIILNLKDLNLHFKRFMRNVTRNFGKVEYIKVVEFHDDKKRYHIHTVIQFQKLPQDFDDERAEKLWKLGICDVAKVYDIRGVLQYLTLPKEGHIHKKNKYLTRFPKYGKLISKSLNFGIKLDKTQYRDVYLTTEQVYEIYEHHKIKNVLDKSESSFVRVDGHCFYDSEKHTVAYCRDRAYIRSAKEFIDSYFPKTDEQEKEPTE